MPSNEPYLIVEKFGETVSGKGIYSVTKRLPPAGIMPPRSKLVLCKELGGEAIGGWKAKQGGCDRHEFLDDGEDLTCIGCGNEFSKFLLRQSLFCVVRGVPPGPQ